MIRKDAAQDTDRPQYYSQYWIDVAMGKEPGQGAVIATPAVTDEAEDDVFDAVFAMPTPAPKAEPKPRPKAQEKKEPARSLTSLADLANIDLLMRNSAEMADDTVPDIESTDLAAAGRATAEPEGTTEFDLGDDLVGAEEPALAAEEEGEFGGDEFEEDEEEDEWGGGRKPKPKKQPPRRERRSF